MINIPDEELREAYWYLMHNPTGFQDDLNEIHPDMAEYLIRSNIIGEGINSVARLRYHLTDFGKYNVHIYYYTLTANIIREELDKSGFNNF